MKRKFIFLSAFLLCTVCCTLFTCILLPTVSSAQTFNLLWTQTINPSAGVDYAYSITADASGIYAVGYDNSPGNPQWRIEKRDLTTGALDAVFGGGTGIVTNNPSVGNDVASVITAGAGGIYVAGWDNNPGGTDYQWRIEKRDLITGALDAVFGSGTGVVTDNPSAGMDQVTAITTGAGGIYVTGTNYMGGINWRWRIEKRDLITGALDAVFGSGTGVITNNPSAGIDYPYAITADASGIYVAGVDAIPGDYQWRIEKRDLITGALITAFDGDGVVANNPSASQDVAYAITADASGIYVAGYDNSSGNPQWRIEKRDLITGALMGVFGTGGVVTNNQSTGSDYVLAVTVDTGGIYVAGFDESIGVNDHQWRIEKRDLTTGTLICTVTNNPSAGIDYPYAITADASGIYAAGIDNIPGNDEWHIEKYDLCGGASLAASITSQNILCNGQCTGIAVAAATGGSSSYTYAWLPGEGTTASATGLCAGTYTVTVTDAAAATTTATVTITQPPAITSTTFSTPAPDGTVTVNLTGGISPYTYLWNTTPPQTIKTATGLTAGVYCCTITDANNCTDTACVTVTIKPIDCASTGEIYLPNTFSPNNDGDNDQLQIYYGNLKCIKKFNLVIYNRCGEKVFETTNPATQWDGAFKEKTEDTAVFVYYMKATLISGEEIIMKGNISLIK